MDLNSLIVITIGLRGGVMHLIIIAISGFICSILITRIFYDFKLLKKDYKNQFIPYSGGTIIFIGTILSFAIYEFYGLVSYVKVIFFILILSLVYIVGFLDDLFGDTIIKGIRNNINALLNKTFSLGMIKGIFFIILSCYLYYFFNEELWILKGILTALLTNLFNLLDLKPGRCIKFYYGFWLLLSFASLRWTKELFVIFSIILAIYYFWDAYGYSMLGDSGSNFVGFITGLTVSEALGTNVAGLTITLVFLTAAQCVLDKHSLTRFVRERPLFDYIDRFLTERQGREKAES
jgi:hypothetical protein